MVTHGPVPNVSGINFELLHEAEPTPPIRSFPTSTSLSTPLDDSNSSINHGAIVGGILGGVSAFVLVVLLIKYCQRRSKLKARDEEKGHDEALIDFRAEIEARHPKHKPVQPPSPEVQDGHPPQDQSTHSPPPAESHSSNPVHVAHALLGQNGPRTHGQAPVPRD
jgi:hypothetical protein